MTENKNWSIGKTSVGDKDFFIRFNTTLKEQISVSDFPIRMGIAIPCGENIRQGILEEFEDYICDFIKDQGRLFVVVSAADGSMKEFVFYVKEGYDFESFHNHLKEKFNELDVQMYANKDVDWQGYEEFRVG